jgi:glucose/arabinose dehydrogenase
MLVVLQDGRIVSFPNDPQASQITTVLDQREITSRSGNEEGLLGLALDPDFAQNGRLYVYYSATPGPRRTVLARLTATGSGASLVVDPGSRLVLLEVPQPFSNHNGGMIAFGPDRMLYVALGDGGSGGDPQGNGQDLKNNLLGSILRLDVRNATAQQPYAIPPDNPFANATDGTKRETWAFGLRNPWRFSFDSTTGTLWAADVGQNAREEIDVIEKGKNYGWNIMEGTACYRPAQGCDRTGLELPITDYGREGGCSVTGGYVYRGRAVPSLAGWYVYGDFCSGRILAIPGDPATARVTQPVEVLPRGPMIASFAEDAAREVYILAFDGRIYRFAA